MFDCEKELELFIIFPQGYTEQKSVSFCILWHWLSDCVILLTESCNVTLNKVTA